MHVGAIQTPGPAVVGSGVVVGLFDFAKVFQLAEFFQTVVYKLPGTIDVFGIDFAFAVNGTATGAIHQTLGTTGNRAYTCEFTEFAVATGQTNFEPFSLLLDQSDELGVDPRIDALVWKNAS